MEITVSSQRRCVLSDRKFGNNFTWLFECFKQNLLVEFDTLINPLQKFQRKHYKVYV